MRYDLTTLSLFVCGCRRAEPDPGRRGRKHMAVSAVSKRITELEQQVGTPLLLRLPRGIELTPAGHSLLFHAADSENLTQMEEDLGDYAAGVRGHIRICAIQATLMHHLPLALNRYLAAFPQTDIDIEERTGMGVVQGAARWQRRCGVLSSWTTPVGLEVWQWRHDSLAALVAIDHPLARHETLSLSECAGEKIIGAHRDSTVSRILEREAAKSELCWTLTCG